MDLAYGKWCTIEGERYMIIDWTETTVKVLYGGNGYNFDMSRVSEVSDFKMTDAERKEQGFAF